jgi:tetratricopeptide (TPR) repeat protein
VSGIRSRTLRAAIARMGIAGIGIVAMLVSACGGAQHGSGEGDGSPDPLDTVEAAELYRRGRILAEQEDYVRAEQYLVAAIERGHSEDEVMPHLIASCVRSSRLSAALRYAEPYLEHNPGAWSLRLLVASIYMGLEQSDAAESQLGRVVLDRPEDATAHYLLAVIARDVRRDADRTVRHFQRYLELAPGGEHADEARAGIEHPLDAPPPVIADAANDPAGSSTTTVTTTGAAGTTVGSTAPTLPTRLPRHQLGAAGRAGDAAEETAR